MNPGLYWIPGPRRGKLAIATRPRGADWLEDEVAGWRRERNAAEMYGIEFISFPIPDCAVSASLPAVRSLLKNIVGALEQGKVWI